MLSEIISTHPEAFVMVIFGGSPIRREEVLNLIKTIPIEITAYGVLSEEEGMEKLKSLPSVRLVLIGGRYTKEQRFRIKAFIARHYPNTLITEPGWEYFYDNEGIKKDIVAKLKSF